MTSLRWTRTNWIRILQWRGARFFARGVGARGERLRSSIIHRVACFNWMRLSCGLFGVQWAFGVIVLVARGLKWIWGFLMLTLITWCRSRSFVFLYGCSIFRYIFTLKFNTMISLYSSTQRFTSSIRFIHNKIANGRMKIYTKPLVKILAMTSIFI